MSPDELHELLISLDHLENQETQGKKTYNLFPMQAMQREHTLNKWHTPTTTDWVDDFEQELLELRRRRIEEQV
jgi:hypothetical protein